MLALKGDAPYHLRAFFVVLVRHHYGRICNVRRRADRLTDQPPPAATDRRPTGDRLATSDGRPTGDTTDTADRLAARLAAISVTSDQRRGPVARTSGKRKRHGQLSATSGTGYNYNNGNNYI